MVFLLQARLGTLKDGYEFAAAEAGPTSSALREELDELILRRLVKESAEPLTDGRTLFTYALSEAGVEFLRKVHRDAKLSVDLGVPRLASLAEEVRQEALSKPLGRLMRELLDPLALRRG